jgi:plastocyanin
MRGRQAWVNGLAIAIAVVTAACGGSQQSAANAPPTVTNPGAPKVDPATAGEVKGTVSVDGAVPQNAVIKMSADPVCSRQAPGDQAQETYVVGSDGKSLGNVFVYVKDGLGTYSFDVPSQPVTLDQQGCRYHPHVFGIQVGQTLEIVNSDPTLHNIHAMPKANAEFNMGQALQGLKSPRVFSAKEVMVPFKCDVHGWMNAYMGVLDHPYFAVTKNDGAFDLKSLPPGTYTLEAWHEKLGTSTQTVTIGDKETKDVSFVFKAPAASTN